ncbi:MAG: ABC transporter substrate-binding protein [Rhodospirillaceae bacterium]|nr:ABC transporter substrate-binding protein [Rhodospirillaceae bacterium]
MRLTKGYDRWVIFFAFALAACGPSQPNDTDSSSVIYITNDVPAGLDYDGAASVIPNSQEGIVNLMDPLIDYAPGETTEEGVGLLNFTSFEGRLAESWSFDEATLTWTFNLRRGVKSCVGNELTADDVIYTFARAKSVSGPSPTGWFLANVASIESFDATVLADENLRGLGDEVKKIDDYTVEIRQSTHNQLFLPALTTFAIRIFDSVEARKHATPSDPWSHDYINNVTAPAFGPYCVERWEKGNEFVLRANPQYYRGVPEIDRVVFKKVPQSSNRFIILRMEQADITKGLTPREFKKLREYDQLQVVGVTGNETLFVHMNFDSPPFDQVKVRQAVAAALPYNWIIKNGYIGQAQIWDGLVPSSYPGGKSTFHDSPEGLDVARQLLAEAGYPEGRGLEVYEDALRLSYPIEKEAILGPIATAIRTALRDIGMPVELDPIPLTQYGDRQLVKKDLPFALVDHEKAIVVDAGYAVQLFFVSSEAGAVNNMVNYRNSRVDDLWTEARAERDSERRYNLVSEIYDYLRDDVVWLPVVEYRTQWATRKGLKGFVWYPDNGIRFADLSYAR